MGRIYGASAISELLASAPEAIKAIYVAPGSASVSGLDEVMATAKSLGIEIYEVSDLVLRGRSGSRGGARIAAEMKAAPDLTLADLAGRDCPLILVLDGITDPYNLGAIVRSAAAFGVDGIVVPKRRSAPLNDAAIRASAGAVAYVPVVRVVNLARAIRELTKHDIWVVGAVCDASDSIDEVDLTLPTALVIGSEGKGIRAQVRKACDLEVGLRLVGPTRSLNASVFTGIALSVASSQRQASEARRADAITGRK